MVGWSSAPAGIVFLSAGLLCCYVATQIGKQDESTLVQEGVFTPGVQVYMVPQNRPQNLAGMPQPAQLQSMADVAMGTHGGGTNGMVTIPPQPPPTWTRGGNAWVYDSIYGTGRRPSTSVWGSGEFPESESEAASPQSGMISQPGAAGAASSVIEQVVEPNGQTVDVAIPASAAPSMPGASSPGVPAVEDIVLPNGKQESIVIPATAPSSAPAPAPASFVAGQAPAAAPAAVAEAQPEAIAPQQAATGPQPAAGCSSPGGCQVPVTMVMQAPAYSSPVNYVPSPQYSQPASYPAGGVGYVLPQQASQQLPMEWAAEDAAEHAYNLAQWRVKILKAKMDQAKLRKELMDETMGGLDGSTNAGKASYGSRKSPSATPALAGGRTSGEVKELKQALLQLAEETAAAIRGLHQQLKAVRSKRKCCVKPAAAAAPTISLAQVEKRRKSLQVEALKRRMDKQLDTLLKKVSNLIQTKRK